MLIVILKPIVFLYLIQMLSTPKWYLNSNKLFYWPCKNGYHFFIRHAMIIKSGEKMPYSLSYYISKFFLSWQPYNPSMSFHLKANSMYKVRTNNFIPTLQLNLNSLFFLTTFLSLPSKYDYDLFQKLSEIRIKSGTHYENEITSAKFLKNWRAAHLT